jgi:alkylhydroperoxidase family enzyme
VTAHAEFLRVASKDAALAAQFKNDYQKAKMAAADRHLLGFVAMLTTHPWLLGENDVGTLHRTGFEDNEILQMVWGCSRFNYLNRMADGIGIRLDYRSDLPAFAAPSPDLASNPRDIPKPYSTPHSFHAWIRAGHDPSFVPRPDEPANFFALLSLNARARERIRLWRGYQLRATPQLDAIRRAEIALYISALNRCEYDIHWLCHNLESQGVDKTLMTLLAEGKGVEKLTPMDRILFDHAERITRRPWTMRESDIQKLRQIGMEDHGILQLTMLSSYWNFENRMVLGLGVPLEERENLLRTR